MNRKSLCLLLVIPFLLTGCSKKEPINEWIDVNKALSFSNVETMKESKTEKPVTTSTKETSETEESIEGKVVTNLHTTTTTKIETTTTVATTTSSKSTSFSKQMVNSIDVLNTSEINGLSLSTEDSDIYYYNDNFQIKITCMKYSDVSDVNMVYQDFIQTHSMNTEAITNYDSWYMYQYNDGTMLFQLANDTMVIVKITGNIDDTLANQVLNGLSLKSATTLSTTTTTPSISRKN